MLNRSRWMKAALLGGCLFGMAYLLSPQAPATADASGVTETTLAEGDALATIVASSTIDRKYIDPYGPPDPQPGRKGTNSPVIP